MKKTDTISAKIYSLTALSHRVLQWRIHAKKIVFTNGVFDILHLGHLHSLNEAAQQGDYLIVALNADSSVRRLKGNDRPVNDENSRAMIMASLLMVDAVVIFDEDTPIEVIKAVMPDVLVKGGDYTLDQIVGAKEVIANGGNVVINPILEGYSTSALIDRMNSGK